MFVIRACSVLTLLSIDEHVFMPFMCEVGCMFACLFVCAVRFVGMCVCVLCVYLVVFVI